MAIINKNKHIEDMIVNPFNRTTLMCKKSRASDRVSYFLSIKNNRGHVNEIYIPEDELDFFNDVIETADKERERRRQKIKNENKIKQELKLKKLSEIKNIEDAEKFIDGEEADSIVESEDETK